MCAALLTSHVKLRLKRYLKTACDMNATYHDSPQKYTGTIVGRIKQQRIFNGTKYLEVTKKNG
jgi:hypothetical protein